MKQLAFDFVAPALPALDNFVTGRNVEAVQSLRDLAPHRSSERCVFVWGAPASGRTHLVRGTLAKLEREGHRVAYLRDESTLLQSGERPLDAAGIDDVERLGEAGQAALFSLYNRLREGGGVVLAAGAVPPAGLQLRADLVTRLAWGLTFEVHALSDAEKAQALAEHAAHRGFGLPPDVLRHLLTHAARDMRTLLALVESLDRYSLESKRAVTVPLLRELLALQS